MAAMLGLAVLQMVVLQVAVLEVAVLRVAVLCVVVSVAVLVVARRGVDSFVPEHITTIFLTWPPGQSVSCDQGRTRPSRGRADPSPQCLGYELQLEVGGPGV